MQAVIVIDVGCARYGGDYSIERLLEEFEPEYLYGFDPMWEDEMLVGRNLGPAGPTGPAKAMHIHCRALAAWTYDGRVGFVRDRLNSWVSDRAGVEMVPCFDLATFIRSLPAGQDIVLKIDAEGSEYDLLKHLIITRTDELLTLAWVEWHTKGIDRAEDRRRVIEKEISCEIREWRW